MSVLPMPGCPAPIEALAARPEHCESVAKLAVRVGLAGWNEREYKETLENPRYQLLVILEAPAGESIGFLLAHLQPPELEILQIGVEPACRRRGLGKALLKSSLEDAGRKACHCAYLEVHEANRNALRFYDRNHFRRVGVRKDYYRDPRGDALVLRRQWTKDPRRSRSERMGRLS